MKEPDWNNIENVFKYTTLGNLARPTEQCGFSDLKNDMIYGIKERSPEVKLQCDPGEHISKDYVSKLLTQDSPVYYRDGETVMHSLSYDHHRYYLEY